MIAGSLIGFFFEGRYEACYYLNDRGFDGWTSTFSCHSFPSKGQRPSIAIIFSSIVCFATFNAKDALSVDILFLFLLVPPVTFKLWDHCLSFFLTLLKSLCLQKTRVVHQKMSMSYKRSQCDNVHLEAVKLLVSSGADINCATEARRLWSSQLV